MTVLYSILDWEIFSILSFRDRTGLKIKNLIAVVATPRPSNRISILKPEFKVIKK